MSPDSKRDSPTPSHEQWGREWEGLTTDGTDRHGWEGVFSRGGAGLCRGARTRGGLAIEEANWEPFFFIDQNPEIAGTTALTSPLSMPTHGCGLLAATVAPMEVGSHLGVSHVSTGGFINGGVTPSRGKVNGLAHA